MLTKKYFILKVDPKKKMMFNPKESIDFAGHTGPFIQYTYARIKSVLRKNESAVAVALAVEILPLEKKLLKRLYDFPAVVKQAGAEYNPSIVANYAYDLARDFNHFYHEINILKEEKANLRSFRLSLAAKTAEVIASSMKLLGIDVPEKM